VSWSSMRDRTGETAPPLSGHNRPCHPWGTGGRTPLIPPCTCTP